MTVVVGAGHAGLAVSHELGEACVDHVVLERDRIARAWRGRWDSFTLVAPNWTLSLPGSSYEGNDRKGTWTATPSSTSCRTTPSSRQGRSARGVSVDALEPGTTTRFRLRTATVVRPCCGEWAMTPASWRARSPVNEPPPETDGRGRIRLRSAPRVSGREPGPRPGDSRSSATWRSAASDRRRSASSKSARSARRCWSGR